MRKLLVIISCIFTALICNAEAAPMGSGAHNAFLANTLTETSIDGVGVYCTSEAYSTLEALLLQMWDNLDDSVDISDLYIEESVFNEYLENIMFSHPEYAYVEPHWYYNYYDYSEDYGYEYHEIAYVFPVYNVANKAEANDLMEAVEEGATRALFNITPQMSDFQKAMELHEYLVLHSAYDMRLYSDNPAQVEQVVRTTRILADGVGVCQAYALAYKYLLNRLGIECEYISSDEMNHGWNLVKLDGKWYHVDLTRDDSLVAFNGSYVDQSGSVDHSHSFLSDSALRRIGYVGYNLKGKVVDSTIYDNAPWRTYSKSPVVYCAGKQYYFKNRSIIDENGVVIIPNIATSEYWPANNETGWMGPFWGGMCEYNNKLYYSTQNTIKCYDPTKPNDDPITIKTGIRGVAGLYTVDNTIVYNYYKYYPLPTGAILISERGGDFVVDSYRVSEVGIDDKGASVNVYNATSNELMGLFDYSDGCKVGTVLPFTYNTIKTNTTNGSFFLWDKNMSPIIQKKEFCN